MIGLTHVRPQCTNQEGTLDHNEPGQVRQLTSNVCKSVFIPMNGSNDTVWSQHPGILHKEPRPSHCISVLDLNTLGWWLLSVCFSKGDASSVNMLQHPLNHWPGYRRTSRQTTNPAGTVCCEKWPVSSWMDSSPALNMSSWKSLALHTSFQRWYITYLLYVTTGL